MKTKIYITIILPLLMLFSSCNFDLDVEPINILTSDQVLLNASGVEAYMSSLYSEMPIEDFRFASGGFYLANQTDEAISSYSGEQPNIPDGTWYPWWGYDAIRNANDLIAKLPEANLSSVEKDVFLGEVLFIRVFYYFGLVKRYGGVPIIKEVQNYTGDNLNELQVARNKEQEVWDFIATDLDQAISLLPEENIPGRATKYAALALKSRAMLHAASIAKYGESLRLDGVIGIPSSEADKYWQAAFNASKLIIDSEKYSLYNKNSDKRLNFEQLFIDSDNPEAIFSIYYKYPYLGHGYDSQNLPFGIRGPGGAGSYIGPSLELVEQFEYIDGTSGTLKIKNSDGSPIYYEHPTDIFESKDPRLLATVIVPFSQFRNNVIDVQAGIYDSGEKIEAGDYSALYNPETHAIDNANGTIRVVGLSGFGGSEKTQSGFYVRKYLNYNMDNLDAIGSSSDQPFMVFRYAEILLNYAEAAIELNKIEEAKWAVNKIRERAGIKLLDDQEVNIENIRDERLVELAFENLRWWDYKRWRISDKILNNYRVTALKPYFDIQQNAYRFETEKTGRYPKIFLQQAYYDRIPLDEIDRNPNLIQNPGY